MESIKKLRGSILLLLDVISINLAYIFSLFVRFDLDIPRNIINEYIIMLPVTLMLYIVSFAYYKMYKSLWRNAGIYEFIQGIFACFIGGSLNLAFNLTFKIGFPISIIISSAILIFVMTAGIRLSYRVYRRLVIYSYKLNKNSKQKVLVIGAGAYAHIVIDEMFKNKQMNMFPVGIIDDNRNKTGTFLKGIKILGDRYEIEKVVKENNVDVIIFAISNICTKDKRDILEICNKTKTKTKVVPGVYEIMNSNVNLTKMRDVDLKDLLGREEIELDKSEVKKYIEGKVILVTGGGGSIGSELSKQIAKFSPKLLLILDVYENNAYDLQNELNRNYENLNHHTIIASVRDKFRMEKIFDEYRPQIVFHAAAHKHVPLMENNSEEAIKNNVVGTLNTAELAAKYNVEKFVLISTDKAVNPTNIMGASKRLCEMIIQAMDRSSRTEFAAVRFGNVLGSNGSVIPLFKKQINNGGPVTLTHKEITRYFMLIPEAAQLVLQAGAYASGGEIFVLDMGEPVKIYDLAIKLIRLSGFEPNEDIDIEEVGLRPGEKLYEELLMSEEGLKETKHNKIFIGRPGNFNIKDVKQNIAELLFITLNEDRERLKSKMKEIVPTYIESDAEKEVAATRN